MPSTPPPALAAALADLVSAVADPTLVLDAAGHVLVANPAASTLLGAEATAVGVDFGLPIGADGAVWLDLHTPGGVRSVEMRAARTGAGAAAVLLVSFRDVTERRRADRALEEAARLGHEVRAGVAAALRPGVDALAAAATGLPSGDRADVVRDLVARLDRDLADATEEWSGDPGEPEAVVTSVADLVARALELRPDLDPLVDVPAAATVFGDPTQLVPALWAVLENAFVHGDGPVEVTARRDGSWTEVRIRDHGPGIAPDEREAAFEIGWVGRGAAGGLGLGLPLTRKLVGANEGNVWSEAAAPGTVLVLRLPALPTS